MHNTTSCNSYIFSLEEPDLSVLRGSGRRYPPVTNGIGDAQRMQDEFIAAHGQEELERRNVIYNKFIGMTEDEKDATNLAHLQKFGI